MCGNFAKIGGVVAIVTAPHASCLVMDMVRTVTLNEFLTRTTIPKAINVGDAMVDPDDGVKMRHLYSW